MSVRVFGNFYLNPEAVGVVVLTPVFSDDTRTNSTVIYDLTGQHILCECVTVVSQADDARQRDPKAVARDNFLHSEIVSALSERRNARMWDELSDKERAA